MKKEILITICLFAFSCTPDQEPIYHLFEHSISYPDYVESVHLVNNGFSTENIDGAIFLVDSRENIELRFKLDDDNETILSKNTIVQIDKFDTLVAENVMRSKFNGLKQNVWNKLNDSTYSALVNYEKDTFKIYLKYRDEAFLESSVDYYHRIIN
jgi:hypothetical protein